MVEKSTKSLNKGESQPMDNCCFDIMTQTEKKADFLYRAADTYIQDANAANRQELAHLWNTIKQDEQRHLDMLKQELARDVQQGRLQ